MMVKHHSVRIKYVLGQGLSADSPEEASNLLLKREYPDIFNDKLDFGFVAIPEGYVPSISKIYDPEIIDLFDKETKEKYRDLIRKFPGDFAERVVYEGLKKYYKAKESNAVLVQGIEIINIMDQRYLRCNIN